MMINIKLEIPDSLHNLVGEIVEREDMSIEQFIWSAMAEKASAFATESYLEERAQRGSRTKFLAAMANVADVEPSDIRDTLPNTVSPNPVYG